MDGVTASSCLPSLNLKSPSKPGQAKGQPITVGTDVSPRRILQQPQGTLPSEDIKQHLIIKSTNGQSLRKPTPQEPPIKHPPRPQEPSSSGQSTNPRFRNQNRSEFLSSGSSGSFPLFVMDIPNEERLRLQRRLGIFPLLLTPDQIKNLPPDKLEHLQPNQIQYITPEQVRNLPPAQLQYLQPDQVRHITPGQIKDLPPNRLPHVLPQTLTIAKTEAAFKTHAGKDYVGIGDPNMQRELIEHSLGFDIAGETVSGATNTVFKSTDGQKVFKPLMDINPEVHIQALDTLRSHNIPLSPIAPLQNVKFTYEVAEHVCQKLKEANPGLDIRNPFLEPEFGHTNNGAPGTAYPFVEGLSQFNRPPQLQPVQWQQAFADLQTISIVATITDQSDLGLENVAWGTDGLLHVIDYDLRSGKSFATPGVLLADKPKRPTTAVGLLKTLPPRGKDIFLDGVDFASGIASETFTGSPEAKSTTERLRVKRGIKLDSIKEEDITVTDFDTFKAKYSLARPTHSKLPPLLPTSTRQPTKK